VPEIVEALNANQQRARDLEEALKVAARPPLDEAVAQQIEAAAARQLQRMRGQLSGDEAREALTVPVPDKPAL